MEKELEQTIKDSVAREMELRDVVLDNLDALAENRNVSREAVLEHIRRARAAIREAIEAMKDRKEAKNKLEEVKSTKNEDTDSEAEEGNEKN